MDAAGFVKQSVGVIYNNCLSAVLILVENSIPILPGSRMTVFRRFVEPGQGRCLVFCHPYPVIMHMTDAKLGFTVALLGGLAIPRGRLGQVLFHPQPVEVHFGH